MKLDSTTKHQKELFIYPCKDCGKDGCLSQAPDFVATPHEYNVVSAFKLNKEKHTHIKNDYIIFENRNGIFFCTMNDGWTLNGGTAHKWVQFRQFYDNDNFADMVKDFKLKIIEKYLDISCSELDTLIKKT